MKIEVYRDWNGPGVKIDDVVLSPRRSQEVWNHSPDGFEWGYGGSGPAQLALAILLEAGLTPERAQHYALRFKWDHVARWKGESDSVEVDVMAWLEKQAP
jgi:hypothetical protein